MKKIEVLESVRGFAAIYVLLHHITKYRIHVPSKVALLFTFGQEAVMLFFLLSGFVIYYSFSKQTNQRFQEYFRRRSVRILPIYVLSLIITYIAGCLNNKSIISFNSVLSVGNLFMLQDLAGTKPGVWFSPAGNSALWSLAYEWWFYLLFFPIINFVKEEKQRWVVASISFIGFASYIAFPNQIGLYLNYFIIWWTGLEVAKVYVSGQKISVISLKIPLSSLLFFTALYFFYTIFYWKIQKNPLHFGLHPFLELRHFGFSFLVVITSLILSRRSWETVEKILSPFAIFSPISYAIYVLHVPLLIGASYLSFLGSFPIEFTLYLIITFSMAYVAEVPYQQFFNRLSRKLSSKTAITT